MSLRGAKHVSHPNWLYVAERFGRFDKNSTTLRSKAGRLESCPKYRASVSFESSGAFSLFIVSGPAIAHVFTESLTSREVI
jgi:hypothetical protein